MQREMQMRPLQAEILKKSLGKGQQPLPIEFSGKRSLAKEDTGQPLPERGQDPQTSSPRHPLRLGRVPLDLPDQPKGRPDNKANKQYFPQIAVPNHGPPAQVVQEPLRISFQ